VYRPKILTGAEFNARFVGIIERTYAIDDEVNIIEAIWDIDNQIVKTCYLVEDENAPELITQEILQAHPYIAFRWQKSSGEEYGRSPVMKVLPDIKTANKVVELVLKNASLAVTGIWQADDDGVLNPTNVKLEPGTIISKAVGSQGLKPLPMSGNFDVSQLVLSDLRSRIRSAMLVDRLSQPNGKNMTATEVMERSSQNATLLEWLDAAKKLGGDTLDTLDKPKLLESIAIDLGVPADLIISPNLESSQTTIKETV